MELLALCGARAEQCQQPGHSVLQWPRHALRAAGCWQCCWVLAERGTLHRQTPSLLAANRLPEPLSSARRVRFRASRSS